MNTLLRRLLIRDDEKFPVLYFLSFFFFTGCGLAVGKASADAMFFKRFGIEYLPLMFIALAVALTLVSLVYAAFVDRLASEKFYLRFFFVLILLLAGTWLLIHYSRHQAIYPFYFLLYEVTSEILLIHGGLYLAQNFDTQKTKRLSPIILAGSQLGLICGGLLVAAVATRISTELLILLWCALLLISIILLRSWHKKHGSSAYFYRKRQATGIRASIAAIRQGLYFSRQSPLLRSAHSAFFFLVICFYLLYYLLNKIYSTHFEDEAELTAFFGLLTAVISATALLVQLLISNRMLEKLGVRKLNLLFPATTLASFAGLLFFFKLPMAVIGSFNIGVIFPAFHTPTRNLLFNVLPKQIQGRSRALSIGLVLPLALIVCAILLIAAQHLQQPQLYLYPGIVASLLLLFFSLRSNRAYLTTLIQHLKDQVYLPGKQSFDFNDKDLLQSLIENIQNPDDQLAISSARILLHSQPSQALDVIESRIRISTTSTADQLLRLVQPVSLSIHRKLLDDRQFIQHHDEHLRATMLQALFQQADKSAKHHLQALFNETNPRLIALAIAGVFHYHEQSLFDKAHAAWLILLQGSLDQQLNCLQLSTFIDRLETNHQAIITSHYFDTFSMLLDSNDSHYAQQTLQTLSNWPFEMDKRLESRIAGFIHNPDKNIRKHCVTCAVKLSEETRNPLLLTAFDDGSADVRQVAIDTLMQQQTTDAIANHWLIEDSYLRPVVQLSILQHLKLREIKTTTLQQLLDIKTQRLMQLHAAHQCLLPIADDSDACYLCVITLKERINQTIEFILTALDLLDESNNIKVVNAAINSRDPALIASACEALKNMPPMPAIDLLVEVLQDDMLNTNHAPVSLPFTNTRETLVWCQTQDDWLNQCATEALKL